MKTKASKIAVVVLAGASILSGCATPARTDQMKIAASDAAKYTSAASPFRNNLAVKDVTGGRETNAMWMSQVGSSEFEAALQDSLKAAGLLAATRQSGDYVLSADLGKLDQPFMGFDMTVTASVTYTVWERKTGKEVYRRTIATPFTAKVSDAFIAVERLKLANEGAVRANLSKLAEELYATKISNVAISAK